MGPPSNPRSGSCYLCRAPVGGGYPNQVCRACDGKATTLEGARPLHASDTLLDPSKPRAFDAVDPRTGKTVRVLNLDTGDSGTNPIFIDALQCWRRYRFGGWVTMADPEGHTTLEDFYGHHGLLGLKDRDCEAT